MTDFYITANKKTAVNANYCASLPAFACSSLNRCNLPAVILGGHTYQQHPVPLAIDAVAELHRDFFRGLAEIEHPDDRALHFRQYMCAAFLLDKYDEAGFVRENCSVCRNKADYLRLLRGWMFNPDGVEGAVMKRWVESRFGLLTLNHRGLLDGVNSAAYKAYQADYMRGLYNSNALESQLDLLYSYCQYELRRRCPERTHWRLYRGVNYIDEHKRLGGVGNGQQLLLLNNLSSFSCERDLSDTFGDVILETHVPVTKLLYFPELLTGVLKGEHEYMVIGGVYQVTIIR
ncbi:MAG: NAD(+)--dinitrogen-reductase ADP-D-ribosyltransferase [Psychromonas sp.]|nr:NAD(+)--dinitrogen-reductase ADP-D-ribosyltransferase [Psychromonas sp.]